MVNHFITKLFYINFVRKIYSSFQTRLLNKHLNQELFESTLTLKNLAIVKSETPLSADFIFETLMMNSNYLKPVFKEMLNIYRSGNAELAFKYFAEKTGTRSGRNFASILEKIDQINPSELIGQMEIFQNMMIETHMTEVEKDIENKSIIVTACSTITMFSLMINFTVVVVFLDTISTLTNLF